MKFPRPFAGVAALCAFVAVAVAYGRSPVRSFDLQGAPALVARPAADITDTYLFPSPNPNDVVAVIDVYPSIAAGSGTKVYFDQTVLYTMKFDNAYGAEAVGGRPTENLVLQFSFGAAGPGQTVIVYGPSSPVRTGASTKLVTATATGFINKSFSFDSGAGTISVFAGGRRDPSFFNKQQFFNIFPDRNGGSAAASCLTTTCPGGFNGAPAVDAFANTNVLSIVAEIPRAVLAGSGNGVVGYWATTSTSTGK